MNCLISADMPLERCTQLRRHTLKCRECTGKQTRDIIIPDVDAADYEMLRQAAKKDGKDVISELKRLIHEMADTARTGERRAV